jgi:signal transduction histidine kinase
MAKPLRILHLEDSPSDSELAREQLAMEGIACVMQRIETREEFVAALLRCDFDLIFADYELPGFDGLSAFAMARRQCADIPFIILTGKMGEELAIESLKSGVTDYVLKHRLSRLAPAVSRALRELLERGRRRVAEAELRQYQEHLEDLVRRRTLELEEKNRQLAVANRDLESFVYSATHDLRTPLVIIGGFTKLLEKSCAGKIDEQELGLLRSVITNVGRMEQLLNDLFTFFQVSTAELRKVEVDMETAVREAFAGLLPLIGEREVRLETGPLPPAYGDPAMIRQVLANLLANAVKYTSRRESARLEVSGRVEPEATVYVVRDNGVGFDMRSREKLFTIFQRLHDRKDFPGTGVGLAIVARIVEKHGGRVDAEGVPEEGASFSFSLPRAPRV